MHAQGLVTQNKRFCCVNDKPYTRPKVRFPILGNVQYRAKFHVDLASQLNY